MTNKNIILIDLLKEFAEHINAVCPETVDQVIFMVRGPGVTIGRNRMLMF